LKRTIIFVAFLVLLLQSFLFASSNKLDGIMAIIGDEIILNSEFDAYVLMRLNGMDNKIDSTKINDYKKLFLNELVEGKVLLAHAKQDTTIQISNQDVENSLRNHINGICQQNNIPLDSLESVLMKHQGMTLSRFKSESKRAIREQMYKQRLQQMFLSSIKVNKKDVAVFYEKYKDSLPEAGESIQLSKISIKISTSDKVKQTAFEKIKSIQDKIDNGDDFSELAKKYSESPDGAEGGDLGFISKGSLGEIDFEEKAFSLGVGQVSDIIETKIGFHLIKAIEKKDQKIHIRQIFVKVAPEENQLETIKAKLDSIGLSCKNQEDFIVNVKKYSDDNISRTKNGSIGWISVLELPQNLKTVIDTFPSGTVTKPVKEENMISIYRIDNKVKSRPLTLDNDYNILAEKTKDIIAQNKIVEMVAQWRKEIYVEIKDSL